MSCAVENPERLLDFDDCIVGLPAGMKISAPYNHDPALLEALQTVAKHLAFIYLPFHPRVAFSARSFTGAATVRGYSAQLRRVAKWSGEHGVGLNLVANAPAWAVDARAVVASAERIRGLACRLRVTFADLLVARQARHLAPWLEIGVSCLAGVETPVQAQWWCELAGASHLTVSREINRQPTRLAALASKGMDLGVVSFDDCVPGCQLSGRHFVADGKPGKQRQAGVFVGDCDPDAIRLRRSHPWVLAQKEILPGHLHRLAGTICEVKVSGRDETTAEVVRRVGLYLEARSLIHPNGTYEEPAGAFDMLAGCDRNCTDCSWCEDNIRSCLVGQGPDGAPMWDMTAVGPQGERLRLWLAPPDPARPPLRQVAGYGVYYSAEGQLAEQDSRAMVDHLADLLSGLPQSGFDPEKLTACLTDSKLPGGYTLHACRASSKA